MMRLEGWKIVIVQNGNVIELEDGPYKIYDMEAEIHCFKPNQDKYFVLDHVFKGYIEEHVESTVSEHITSASLAQKVVDRIQNHPSIDLQFWKEMN